MDRPNLTPEHQQDTDPTEQSIDQVITSEYSSFAELYPGSYPFIVTRMEVPAPITLDEAIAICKGREAKGTPREVLLDMLKDWNEIALAMATEGQENPDALVEVEGLREQSKQTIAKYVLSMKG